MRKLPGLQRRGDKWRLVARVNGRLKVSPWGRQSDVELRAWRTKQIGTREGASQRALREHAVASDVRRLPSTDTTWCFVYFVQSGDTVKIGRSLDPVQRVRELQTTHAGELILLATVAAHSALEGALHRRFGHLRTRANGEWFTLDAELTAFIRAVQQGANPVALLFEDPREALCVVG